MEKPAVLIVGGLGKYSWETLESLWRNILTILGFIGRHLALYLHENNLASEVRLVDKVLPQLAWLAPEFAEACSQDKFVQADASRERECQPLPPLLPPQRKSSLTLPQNTSRAFSTEPMAKNSTT